LKKVFYARLLAAAAGLTSATPFLARLALVLGLLLIAVHAVLALATALILILVLFLCHNIFFVKASEFDLSL
jgi:hypothetical protein